MCENNENKDVELLTKKIVKISLNKKRKDKETLENIPKFRKLERCSKLPKEFIYICYKHDHNPDNCNLYECDGVQQKSPDENHIKYYIS